LIKSCILFLEIDQRGAAALIASHGCPRRTNQTCQERPMDRSLSALTQLTLPAILTDKSQ
jgi:hypothetical protein